MLQYQTQNLTLSSEFIPEDGDSSDTRCCSCCGSFCFSCYCRRWPLLVRPSETSISSSLALPPLSIGCGGIVQSDFSSSSSLPQFCSLFTAGIAASTAAVDSRSSTSAFTSLNNPMGFQESCCVRIEDAEKE